MKIYLGAYYADVFGDFNVYLGIDSPKYDCLNSGIFDTSCIIVDGSKTEIFSRSPHDFWRLSNLVGSRLAGLFMNDLARYATKSFYYVYEHSHCGRLYFEPTHPEDDPHCDHFRVTGGDGIQVMTLAGFEQLMHFMCADKVSGDVSWLPSGNDIKVAISIGKRMAKGIQLTHAAMRQKIDWSATNIQHASDVKDGDAYKALSSLAVDESKSFFLHNIAYELVSRCNSKTLPHQAELDKAAALLDDAGLFNHKFQAV